MKNAYLIEVSEGKHDGTSRLLSSIDFSRLSGFEYFTKHNWSPRQNDIHCLLILVFLKNYIFNGV